MNTGCKSKGGKEIRSGDIVRPCKRPNRIPTKDMDKTWRVEFRECPFMLVDTETGKPYAPLEPWCDGELVIVGHVGD